MYEWKINNLLKSQKPFLEQGRDALPRGSGRGVELPRAREGARGASSSQLRRWHAALFLSTSTRLSQGDPGMRLCKAVTDTKLSQKV